MIKCAKFVAPYLGLFPNLSIRIPTDTITADIPITVRMSLHGAPWARFSAMATTTRGKPIVTTPISRKRRCRMLADTRFSYDR